MQDGWRNSPECLRAEAEGRRDFWHGESNPVKCGCKYDAIDDPVENAGYITGYFAAEGEWAERNSEERARRAARRAERLIRADNVSRCLERLDRAMPMGRTAGLVYGGI